MKEIIVNSWNDLNFKLHSDSIFTYDDRAGGHLRSPFVFRGMVNAEWDLKTSLQRLGSPIHTIEASSIRSFRKYALSGTFKDNTFWEVLSVAQHNGLPTRCLDWSASPLIAAHFATDDPAFNDKDGIIWGVNIDTWKHNSLDNALKDILDKNIAWVFDIKMLNERFPSLEDLTNYGSFGRKENKLLVHPQVLFFEPPSIDQRIQNQYGLLSVSTDPELEQLSFFKDIDRNYPDLLARIVISSKSKSEIRDVLDNNNINERMLFPGLPGLCIWLKRHYGPNK